jgi:hypothetical protein
MSREHLAEDIGGGESAEMRITRLARVLDELRFAMQNIARGSILEHVEGYFPDEIAKLHVAAEACKGLPVTGTIETSEYFLPQPEVFQKALLPIHKNAGNDFEGVFRGAAEVPTPRLNGRVVGRLCIAVDPLVALGDPGLSAEYAVKGWTARLRHPFAESDNQDARIYIAVDSIGPDSVGTLAALGC